MFQSGDSCDRCKRSLGPRECLYELGKDYVCEQCMERHFDELEAYRDAVIEEGVNYLREHPIRRKR